MQNKTPKTVSEGTQSLKKGLSFHVPGEGHFWTDRFLHVSYSLWCQRLKATQLVQSLGASHFVVPLTSPQSVCLDPGFLISPPDIEIRLALEHTCSAQPLTYLMDSPEQRPIQLGLTSRSEMDSPNARLLTALLGGL